MWEVSAYSPWVSAFLWMNNNVRGCRCGSGTIQYVHSCNRTKSTAIHFLPRSLDRGCHSSVDLTLLPWHKAQVTLLLIYLITNPRSVIQATPYAYSPSGMTKSSIYIHLWSLKHFLKQLGTFHTTSVLHYLCTCANPSVDLCIHILADFQCSGFILVQCERGFTENKHHNLFAKPIFSDKIVHATFSPIC